MALMQIFWAQNVYMKTVGRDQGSVFRDGCSLSPSMFSCLVVSAPRTWESI